MGNSRKTAAFDLFQGPPSSKKKDEAPKADSLDLFARPPERAPVKQKPAPEKPPEDLQLFGRPPKKTPSAPPKAPKAPEDLQLFGRPPSAQAPSAPPSAPTPSPATPTPAQSAPSAPSAPTPPTPAQAPHSAPSAPGRIVPQGEGTEAMRRTRDFKQFLREKYEGGQADIRHPDPERRRRGRGVIKFWTAMKYDTFKGKVKREFAAWREEAEAQRPRVQPGSHIESLDQIRAGDFIGKSWGTKYKVLRTNPRSVVAIPVDQNGRPKGGREKRFSLQRLRQDRMMRHEEMKRPDVPFNKAIEYVDNNFGFPPRSVQNKQQYADWLKNALTKKPNSPFFRLGDDETRHHDQLKQHLDRILDHRGVRDDWTWAPPPPVEIGQRVQHPGQLKAGDFVQYNSRKYRVSTEGDDYQLVLVDPNGRSVGSPRPLDQWLLKNTQVTRVTPVQRPDIPLEKAKNFADVGIGFPPRNIDSRAKYQAWLEEEFKTKTGSPYKDLGPDETEHERALKKQIGKILEDRNVGPEWEWEGPPELAVGDRLHDGHQLRPGHFIKGRYHEVFKVVEVNDNGSIQAIPWVGGRPRGPAQNQSSGVLRRGQFSRINKVERPEVTWDKAKAFIDGSGKPGRSVTNKEKYQTWVKRKFTEDPHSPFYLLGDDEVELKEELEKFVNKVLEDRNVGDDWVWTPPKGIKFPPDPNWRERHQGILDVVRNGTKKGRDRPMGGGGNVNAPVRRVMARGDQEEQFIFKSKHGEPGQAGSSRYRQQLSCKAGVPSGQMHNREAAAYALDELLGEGTVVPVTASTGTGKEGLGAYQQIVPSLFTALKNGGDLRSISNEDLLRNPDVGRQLVLDVLMGHQDRHHGNMGFSWNDPNGPKTAENLRVQAIDNGYALAETKDGQNPDSWDIRDNWFATGGSERRQLLEQFFDRIPEPLLEKLKDVSTKDVTKALAKNGLTNKSVIESVALRLAVLKSDPELLGRMIAKDGSRGGQQEFQYQSHHKPGKLMVAAGLPKDTYRDIQRDVAEGLQDA